MGYIIFSVTGSSSNSGEVEVLYPFITLKFGLFLRIMFVKKAVVTSTSVTSCLMKNASPLFQHFQINAGPNSAKSWD